MFGPYDNCAPWTSSDVEDEEGNEDTQECVCCGEALDAMEDFTLDCETCDGCLTEELEPELPVEPESVEVGPCCIECGCSPDEVYMEEDTCEDCLEELEQSEQEDCLSMFK